MFTHETFIRVRYQETDQMGVVHHGNYASYLELSRIEWLDAVGFSYKKLESEGIMLPVYKLDFVFKSPAYFDDELRVRTSLEKLPRASIIFNYEIYNQHGKLLTTAQSILVFVNKNNWKPISCPGVILERLKELKI